MITPIYLKTTYTFLTSLITIDGLIAFAKQNNMQTLCICDDNMYGVMEFIRKTESNHIKPIIGLDIEICLLYAKNYQGYQNLLKLSTIKSERSITFNDLKDYYKDLICVIPFNKQNNALMAIFSDYYIGISNNEEYLEIIKKKLKYLYITETLCLNKEDLETLKCLHMLRDNKTLSDEYTFFEDVYYNNIDMNINLNNNIDFLNRCQLVLPKYSLNLPEYVLYNNTLGLSSDEYLYNLSVKGLSKRLDNKITNTYKERLLRELSVIKEMGFSNYFLIVYDYISYAKKNSILVGPGRGSAAGSLVSFCLGITEVDPIKYDLLFERFLNNERITMPDIDTDFPDNRRDDMIKYVVSKYGLKKVVGVTTFGTFGAKMALRDMGRVMNVPLYTIDELCKLIGNSFLSLQSIYEANNKFKLMIDSDNKLRKLFNCSLKIEGLPRHTSIHAAGIIMANDDLDNIIPLVYNDSMYLSGYDASYLEDLGLLKMDFLGLKNLTTIDSTISLINEKLKLKIRFSDIPLDDDKTFKLFQAGDTLGIFQFESMGMRDFLRKLHPESFEDIYNANAFFRPGPSDSIPLYIKRKEGKEPIDYLDERLKRILDSTYGIIVYQEQIMLIASTMANFTLGEADILRRAMSKKKKEVLTNLKEKFINGSVNNGYTLELSERIFDLILNFASYGFNKSHSVAYSMVAYRMAYLKSNYPLYFYLALLNSVTMDDNKTIMYIKEIKKKGLKVVKPSINNSSTDYKLYYDSIVLPFTLIKGISSVIAKKIIEARKDGFTDIYDFFSKAINNNITRTNIESLINSGSLDSFNYSRKTLYQNIDSLINYANLTRDLNSDFVLKPELEVMDEFSKDILIATEKETFGFYLTNHPVSVYKNKFNDIVNFVDIKNYFNNNITTIGMIDQIKEIVTKNNEKMAFINASDEESNIEYILFPKVYKDVCELKKGDIIKVVGRVERRNDFQVIVSSISKVKE